MPAIIIFVVIAAIVGLGGYFFTRSNEVSAPAVETPAENTPNKEEINKIEPESAESPIKDGVYTVQTTYTVPSRAMHTVDVKMTLANGIITDSDVVFGGDSVEASTNYQNKFLSIYKTEVVGKKLSDVSLSRVGGASLTSNSFNEAVAKVMTQAQS